MVKPPTLVAHRGYPRHFPENTLIGLEAAIAAGARFVEVDVQVSRDRVPVLFHDDDTLRVCGMPGQIQTMYYEELWHLHVSERERFGDRFKGLHITRLAELGHLLMRRPHVTAFVELKQSAIARFGIETLLTLVRRSLKPALNQCVLISYSLEAMATAQQHGGWRIGVVIDRWEEHHSAAVQHLHPEFIFCDVNGLPELGPLDIQGSSPVIFEVGDPATALALAARGIRYVETFSIGELQQEFTRLTSHG